MHLGAIDDTTGKKIVTPIGLPTGTTTGAPTNATTSATTGRKN